MDRLVDRSVKQPAYHAQRKHIAGLEDSLIVQTRLFEGLFRQRRQRHRNDLHRLRDMELRKRIIGLVLRFLQIDFRERIGIDDNDRVVVEQLVLHAHFERGGVHRYDHIRLIAGSIYSLTEVNLETADTAKRALRRTNLSGKVRKGRNLVAQNGGQGGKHVSRQLHAVTGIAAKTNYNIFHVSIYYSMFRE